MVLIDQLLPGLYRYHPPERSAPERVPRLSMGESDQPQHDDRNREQSQLAAAMARGDKAALATLYDQLSGPLYSLALRMLADAGEAQDIVQDIFLQAWRTAASYEPARGSVFTWLATLVRNRAIDRLRMRKRRSELLKDAAPDLQPHDGGGPGESGASLWQQEKASAVRAALADLPEEQQRALQLAYFSGLTQQEIAVQLNEPLGTIKARIRRGLLRLKDRLPARL